MTASARSWPTVTSILGGLADLLVGWCGMLVPALIRSIETTHQRSDAEFGVYYLVLGHHGGRRRDDQVPTLTASCPRPPAYTWGCSARVALGMASAGALMLVGRTERGVSFAGSQARERAIGNDLVARRARGVCRPALVLHRPDSGAV